MSNKHYYISNPNSEKGFDKVTEAEFFAIIGDEKHEPYVSKVYQEQITIDDVPEENREAVQAIVNAKIARFGLYKDQPISPFELQKMIKGVM